LFVHHSMYETKNELEDALISSSERESVEEKDTTSSYVGPTTPAGQPLSSGSHLPHDWLEMRGIKPTFAERSHIDEPREEDEADEKVPINPAELTSSRSNEYVLPRRPNTRYDYAMDMDVGWSSAAPEDAFIHFMTFLNTEDLNSCATVNKCWNRVVTETPFLWRVLDLGYIWHRVNDQLVISLLKSKKFSQVEIINLEGCVGITKATVDYISRSCPDLLELHLTDCHNVDPNSCVELAMNLPGLRVLSIYGVARSARFGRSIHAENRAIQMPLYWKRVCADYHWDEKTARPVQIDQCRHGTAFAERACWGTMSSRCVYSNQFFHRPGNFPQELLHSCQLHEEDDFKDQDLFRCTICQRFFRRPSMWEEVTCKTCYDNENLRDKSKWILLTPSSIKDFGLDTLFNNLLILANPKNLPHTLKEYGASRCRLDYRMPDGSVQYNHDNVPFDLFRAVNHRRVNHYVSQLKEACKEAAEAGETRAVLVLTPERTVKLFADKYPVLQGYAGEMHIKLTQRAWNNVWKIVSPFLVCCVVVMLFKYTIFNTESGDTVVATAYAAQLQDSQDSSAQLEWVLILAGVFLVVMFLALLMAVRFREQCVKVLKGFVFLDLLFLYVLGGLLMVYMGAMITGLQLETISTAVALWNFGILGMLSLYAKVPPYFQRIFRVALFSVMSVMMVQTLNKWIVFFFAAAFALYDFMSAHKPAWRLLCPFLLPPNTPLAQYSPRILYPINGAVLRSVDILWFGIAFALVDASLASLFSVCTVLMFSLIACVFVGPYLGFGSGFRPVILAFAMLVVFMVLEVPLSSFINHQNLLTTTLPVL